LVLLSISAWWIAGIIYVVLAVIVYLVQERFIFKPEKLPANFAYKYDAPFRELNFEPEQGVTINGLHFYVPKPKGAHLVFSWQ
jgi:hypothetical protein